MKVFITNIEADITRLGTFLGDLIDIKVNKYKIEALIIKDSKVLSEHEISFTIDASEMPDKISDIRKKIKSLYKDDHNEKETK